MSCHCCPPVTIVAPTQVIVQDIYDPQLVQVIHPINIVTRRHCVPVYEHLVKYNVVSEAPKAAVCSTAPRRKRRKR
ncbi:MAG: hypothetical protein E7L01_32485 [Paenibacillus macerans]|uniref:Spore coat protein D n=1 Tax=Paenibacillus macerans TaxID=44252 RepID=A0A090ZKE5_PAEMA|nr:hypothetical protein [Paenibacillus macerans]KFN10740.1 hypothetical protein DJ90_3983 [Paenibacillus macerans]MCY7562455.1 hypothetical protein [Paenibacillus macerans]MDU7478026.1 hypothetical protein [Paenibacillus macerans]MEC0141446.1 hypothetical protein [Paenibacillus macerans]MEC0152876.1 hypothetical protein [Paenibacillus macerans]